MTRQRLLLSVGVVVAVAAALVLTLWRRDPAPAAEAGPNVTASITAATAQRRAVDEVVSLYGTVQADPAAAMVVAAPRPLIISRLMVRPGQPVSAGEALVEVANAPGAGLAFRQASDAEAFAKSELARVQRLYDDRLAASDQLNAAKKALADADAALAAQRQQGGGRSSQVITAPRAAVVTGVSVSAGDRVAQDSPLLTLAGAGAVVAKLALQPSAAGFRSGQSVLVHSTLGGSPISSRLTVVGRAADPTTKAVDALAPLAGSSLPIGSAVQAEVVMGSHQGLLVPRASVVFDETGPHLFTVSGGAAHRVFVTVGPDHGDDIEISGLVVPGAQVAVEGAYELQDGMHVTVRGK